MNFNTFIALLVALSLPLVSPAFAQENPADEAGAEAEKSAAEPAKRAGDWRVRVTVRGPDGSPLADKPVFLRAARPRGPFEPTAPEPVREWTEFSNAEGVALFDIAPQGLDGLRIHAVTTYDGQPFESAAVTPGDGVKLSVRAHERTLDPGVVKIKSVRTVVQLWEEYLVFSQFYQLQNTSDLALDVAAIPDPEFERGIPLALPVKAQGIQAMGPGETAVVDSTVHWKGFMKPGQVINLQIRFSMTAQEESFVYEQALGYDADEVEVVVPLQTDFEKLPRLDTVTLKAPGFKELGRTQNGKSPLDLRSDMEFLAAWGNPVAKGESFTFKLEGLPFHKPVLPWFFLIGGIVMAIGIVFFARKEAARMSSKQGTKDLKLAFEAERSELLAQLEELERQQRGGARTAAEYQAMKMSLREQLALILKKIHDLEDDA